jgi:hypothetical protein
MHKTITSVLCAALAGCGFSDFNPDLGSLDGTETGDSTTDVGTADTGSETDTSGSTTSETDTGSTDETGSTGDGDGDTGTETGDPDPLNPGDLCHPFNAILDNMAACPAQTHCVFNQWDTEGEFWNWTCQLSEGMGEYGDDCLINFSANQAACAEGFHCQVNQGGLFFPEEDCAEGFSCCVELCDVFNPSCQPDFECDPWGGEASSFPPFFADSDIPFVGLCNGYI